MFTLNHELLASLRREPTTFDNVYWVIGGACSGKSTVCRAIAAQHALSIYDMDEHFFGDYMGRYAWERHPASKRWFSADNPLEWVLSLAWPEFNSLYRAANLECLDLFAEDLRNDPPAGPLIVDGGITHPTVLAQVLPATRIFCIGIDSAHSADCWNHDPARMPMKEMVLKLDNPNASWPKFLGFDRLISATIVDESEATGIKVQHRDDDLSVTELAAIILDYFQNDDGFDLCR